MTEPQKTPELSEQTQKLAEETITNTPTVDSSIDLADVARLAELEKRMTDPDYQAYLNAKKSPEEERPVAMPDFDDMTNNKMMEYILKIVNSANKKTTGQFGGVINNLQETLGKLVVGRNVEKASAKYEDFKDLDSEIAKILKDNPGASLDLAYKGARFDWAKKELAKKDSKPPMEGGPPPADPVPGGTLKVPKTNEEMFNLSWKDLVGDEYKSLDHLE